MAAEDGHFVIHHVSDDQRNSPSGVNCHTHGLTESCGHRDLQITLPIRPTVAAAVLNHLHHLIAKCGMRFNPGDRTKMFADCHAELTFVSATESGRAVLRVVLPDPAGELDYERMDPLYRAAQFG